MNTQRGNQLYVAAGAVLGVALLVAGLLWYVAWVRAEAFQAGHTAATAAWQAREGEELRV